MSIGSVNVNTPSPAVQGTAPAGGHHHGGLKAVAAALGLSTSDLRSELQSGKSLDDVAKEKGVSHSDLVAAIKSGLPKDVQASANADQLAEAISTRAGGPGRPGGPGGPGGPAGAGGPDNDGDHDGSAGSITGALGGTLSATQSKVLDALSSALGTDTTSLVAQLKAGTSLSSIAAGQGVDGGKLADILQNGLLFDAKA